MAPEHTPRTHADAHKKRRPVERRPLGGGRRRARRGPSEGRSGSARGSLTRGKTSGRDEPLNVGVNGFSPRGRQHPSADEQRKLFRTHTHTSALDHTRPQSRGHWIRHLEKKVRRVAGQERRGRGGPDSRGSFRPAGDLLCRWDSSCSGIPGPRLKGSCSGRAPRAAGSSVGLCIHKDNFLIAALECTRGGKELPNTEE